MINECRFLQVQISELMRSTNGLFVPAILGVPPAPTPKQDGAATIVAATFGCWSMELVVRAPYDWFALARWRVPERALEAAGDALDDEDPIALLASKAPQGRGKERVAIHAMTLICCISNARA